MPFDTSRFPFFLFNQFSRFLGLCRCSSCFGIGVFVTLLSSFGFSDRLFLFMNLDSFVVGNIVQYTLRTQFRNEALGIYTTVKHAHDVMCSRKNQLDMMGDKDLYNGKSVYS